jgi:iron complex outermembrane receptor protein
MFEIYGESQMRQFKHMKSNRWYYASGMALAICMASPASAQSDPAANDSEVSEGVNGLDAPEIIVTAQFRKERAQDTALTLLARDGNFLEERQVADVKDLAVSIPGFQAGGSYQAAPQYSIRGTRSATIDIATEDGLASYFDGVYVARPAGTTLDIYELERIEVLKGPQGTLYGRNAVGGVINYITPTPNETFSGKLTAETGNYGMINARGRINVPLSETVFANAAFSIRQRDGYVKNLYTGNDLSDQDSWAMRGALKWQVSERSSFILRGDYNHNDNVGPGFTTIPHTTLQTTVGAGPPTSAQVVWFDPTSTNPLLNPTGKVITDIHQSLQSEDGFEKRTAYGFSLTGNFETDAANIVSISAYRYLHTGQLSDFDATPCLVSSTNFLSAESAKAFAPGNPNLLGTPRCITLQDTATLPFLLGRTVPAAYGMDSAGGFETLRDDHAKQYSQEFRLLSTPGGALTFNDRLSWVLGGLVFYENARRNQADRRFGVEDARTYYARNKGLSVGLYSQATLKLTDNLSIIGGLRYSYDRKRFEFSQLARPSTAIFASSGGRPVLTPFDFTPTINYSNLPGVFGFPIGFPNPALTNGAGICPVGTRCLPLTKVSKSWSSVDPKIGVEFRATPDILIYANYTQGYKGGGFATTGEDLTTATTPYDPETIKAYEAGIKTSWFNRRLTANLAVYRNDSKNVQIQSGYDHDNNPATFPFVGVQNAAGLKAQGVEVELTGRPMRGLSLYAVYAYTDAKFKNFPVFGGGVQIDNYAGNQPLNQPKHSLGAGLSYSVPVGGSWELGFTGDYAYRSHVYFSEGNFPEIAQGGYSLVNASISLGQKPTGIDFRIWARNLFNKDYLTHVFTAGAEAVPVLGKVINAQSYAMVPGAPRTYGITASWEF